MTVAEASPGITVAGRIFRPVTSSTAFGRNFWLMSKLSKVNLVGITSLGDVLDRVAEADIGAGLLAGLFVEEKQGQVETWTPDAARRYRVFFESRDDIADATVMINAITVALPLFFSGAKVSPSDTPASSASPNTTPTTSEAGTSDSEAPDLGASSAPSSPDSPETT